jgi:hypothetical protein
VAYLQKLLKEQSGTGRARNYRNIGSPFMEKGKLRTFLKDPLLQELGNYSI